VTRLRIRPLADRDTDEVAEYLAREANLDVALRFLWGVESTYGRIVAHAEAGSPVHAFDTRLAGLRHWPVDGFEQYLVFYVSLPAFIDIVRVLHGARDLDALFGGGAELG
jgi:toxin ParE1/3/4